MIIRNDNGKLTIINKNTFVSDSLYYKQIYDIKYKLYGKYKNYINYENYEYNSINKPIHISHTDWLIRKNIILSSK